MDLISRQAAIDAIKGLLGSMLETDTIGFYEIENVLFEVPSAQPDITDEQAIGHLQASGWMQSHDKQMYEMGLKERLADDSDSYDALLPAAEPTQNTRVNSNSALDTISRQAVIDKEPGEDVQPVVHVHWIPDESETGEGSNTYKCSACGEIQVLIYGTPKENGWNYCPHCGAKMDEVERGKHETD